jgi:hypothetical protein
VRTTESEEVEKYPMSGLTGETKTQTLWCVKCGDYREHNLSEGPWARSQTYPYACAVCGHRC